MLGDRQGAKGTASYHHMGAIQSSDSFPWFRFKLTPSADEVEAEDAREAAAAAPDSSGGTESRDPSS